MLIALEIATTARNEVSNVQKDVDAGFDLVIVLPENETVKKAVERKFNRELSSHYLKRVKIISIPEFLSRSSPPWNP